MTVTRVTDSEIRCSMQRIRLPANPHEQHTATRLPFRDRPKYYAISYTWGSSETSRSIVVDNETFPVRENLWQALHRFGTLRQLALRTFWIDAVCINQRDVPERTAQVRRMADIFVNARRTLVWLGEATRDFQVVKRFIEHLGFLTLGRTIVKGPFNESSGGDLFAVTAALTDQAGTQLHKLCRRWQACFDKSNTLWQALTAFLKQPWFRRMWIIQETVLASWVRIQIGKHHFAGPLFAIAFRGISILVRSRPHLVTDPEAVQALGAIEFLCHATVLRYNTAPFFWNRSVFRIYQNVESPGQRYERMYDQRLEVLVGHTLSARTSDPRDRVFALLSLAAFDEGQQLLADYGLETPQEVYRRFASFCLESLKSPTVLSLAGTEIHGQEWSLLPSWIPDLNQHSTHGQPPQSMVDTYLLKCATAMEFVPRILDGDTLQVRATTFATVQWISSPPLTEPSALESWFQDCDTLGTRCPSPHLAVGESFDVALWKTIVWNVGTSDAYSSYRAFRSICKSAAINQHSTNDATQKKAHEFRTRFNSIGYGTRKAMMITDSGRLISGPVAAQVQDKVCVIAGARVPFILMQTDKRDVFRLVGECYVYGLADGEILDINGVVFEDIKLR